MKIALCLSGFARVYHDTFPLLQRNVLNILKAKHGNVDIFFSTWKKVDRGGYKEWHDDPVSEMDKYYKPIKLEIEDNFEYEHRYYSMFYKVWKSWQLMEQHENENGFKYDLVIRDRCDTCWLFPIKISEIERSIKENIFLIPRYYQDHGKFPLQDWNAWGPREAMFNYCNAFNYMKDVDIPNACTETHFDRLLREEIKQKWDWSTVETTPYDRYFGNRVHERFVHQDGEMIRTTIYNHNYKLQR